MAAHASSELHPKDRIRGFVRDRTLQASAVAVAFVSLLGPTSLYADATKELEKMLASMETLRADVQQLIVEEDGGVLEESSIRMMLKQPNGFAWETLEPFPELLISNGTWLWNYQPDLEQLVIEPWRSEGSELAAQLLSGRVDGLSEEYEITSTGGQDGLIEFALSPRDVSTVNRLISLSFLAGRLDGIVLEARSGQRTLWRFENVVLNAAIDDSEFEFVPPEGIEVIRNDYIEP